MRPDISASRGNDGKWSVLWLIVAFPVFWTLYASLSRYNLDRMGDMVENFAWGISWQLGYYKHPPFYSWITAAWFSVFPRTDFFYHLLASMSVTVALLAIWRISTRFFTVGQQRALLVAVFFLPPLTFLTRNYNATSAMLPLWAFTFLFYLRVLERRRSLDAVLLGVLGGCAILTKYHSVVLVIAIALHALLDRDVRGLLLTRLPVLAMAAGALVLAPHLWWMWNSDFITVRYASEQGDGNWRDTLIYAARFIPVVFLYSAPMFAVLGFYRRLGDGYPLFSWPQVAEFWTTSQGRALVCVAALPPVITIVLGLALDALVSSLWSIPFFVFIPFFVVALLPRELTSGRRLLAPIAIGAYAVILLVLAPVVRGQSLAASQHNSAVPISGIAQAAQTAWYQVVDGRFAIVAGQSNLYANGTAFYAPDRPYAIQGQSLKLTPWVTKGDIAREGAAFVCNAASQERCEAAATALFGRVDQAVPFSVPAPAGAKKTTNWEMVLLVRNPD
ncbi:MAG: glycosyltransferase family 39 protein [Rhizobiaceae bacterium]|nr:glycosyltransferase family 39 protein [Rhizobiaceae bacterium]